MQLENRVAFITGGSSGIGAASAVRLARAGAQVAILGRSEDELQQVVEKIEKAGGKAMAVLGDVADVESMQDAYARVINQWGKLDSVVANAGINGVWAPIEELSPEDWQKTIDINLNGTFYTVKYAVPHLKRNGGAIVVTSSVNGTRMYSNTGATAYACSKGGQVILTKMLALELAKHQIRINAICPGAIETQIDDNTERRNLEKAQEPVEFPAGKVPLTDGKPGTSEQVAELVLFLVSDASSHITGSEVWIDGGQSLLQG
jgi:NAD(P)-dependent dehydrogenase (short-subunit alcohol dehydrogenase family)